MSKSKKIGCYIHIPFCNTICSYCDFCKIYYNKKIVDTYLEELDKEIEASYHGEMIDTLYIGGGTPSCLSDNQLEKLLNILRNRLNLKEIEEFTIECNFDSITEDKIDILIAYGINRISFGLESIDANNLNFFERSLDKKKVMDMISYCKQRGLYNINVDLMYAIPNETIETLQKDIDFIKSLDVSHISTYSLILVNHTKLQLAKIESIDEDIDATMYQKICESFNEFDHYEISNFAKEEKYRSKHNLKYWNNEEYYGYGLGASGYEGSVRYTKTKSITKYLDGDYIKEDGIEYLNTRDEMEYQVILNLRIKEGIDLEKFEKTYHKPLRDVYQYEKAIEEGYLQLENNHLFIPERLWYISNSIILKVLEKEVEEKNE